MGFLLMHAEWRHPKAHTPGWVKLLEGKKVHRVLPSTWLVAGRGEDTHVLRGRVVDGLRHGDTLVARSVDRAVWTEAGVWGPEPVVAAPRSGTPSAWLLVIDAECSRRVDAIHEGLGHLLRALGREPCRRHTKALLGFTLEADAEALRGFCANHLRATDRYLLCRQDASVEG
ncbi:hypothetical protein JYJ95_29655 [Corallococcus exiguus]|uniref:hypothetical protein n=1 Tax=Corallococcus exiguus TaxID=83462 RepID=UPI001A909DA8|nr:hypothetical protein [Corallococcus exiguus]MBN8470691.1 hypothetical protein [Corallococcus exiguus]